MSTGNENKICAKKADAKDWLAEAAHLSVYYEYYGALLPEKQRLIFEDYIANDMSLSEISKEYGLSRQGVYDAVRRCGAKLYEYEEKLRLAERFHGLEKQAERIVREASGIAADARERETAETAEAAEKLAALARELWECLQ
ncbi:MAG: DNA-binding protein [Lachnospiraceae bacterium]|nr:DNA-binding protein [Lachnospiraceae bacterium]